MHDYGEALLIDGLSVVCCFALLLRFAVLRFSHPATPYMVFHLHTVTVRLMGLLNGADTIYSSAPADFDPVRSEEIIRAALYCDIALWSVTAAWVLYALLRKEERPATDVMYLEPRVLKPVLAVAFIMGIVGLRIATALPGVTVYEGIDPNSAWSSSSYLIILPSWFGLAVLGHIYYYGFKPLTFTLLGVYLVIMSLQGGMRFRVIIGLILAIQIWIEQRNRRWPTKLTVVGLGLAALAFFPMKTVGFMVREGASTSEIGEVLSTSITDVSEGANTDQMFLDEMASALTLIDMNGKWFYGSMYLPMLTLPIPRALWPDKPGLSGFLQEISTSHRPMAACGMITTYLGEAYANFGVFGVVVVPPIVALFLAMFYRAAYSVPRLTELRFAYVLVSVNLIQVYRDGLLSVFVFTMVNMMPLAAIVLAHVAIAAVRKRRHLGLAASAEINPVFRPLEAESGGRGKGEPH
jgi:hypothetical protein